MPPSMTGSPPKVASPTSAFDAAVNIIIWPRSPAEQADMLSFKAATDARFPPAFSKSDERRLKAMSKEEAEKVRSLIPLCRAGVGSPPALFPSPQSFTLRLLRAMFCSSQLRASLLDKTAKAEREAENEKATAKTEWARRQKERATERKRKEEIERKAVEAGLQYYKSGSGGTRFNFAPTLIARSPSTSPAPQRPPAKDPRPRGYHVSPERGSPTPA